MFKKKPLRRFSAFAALFVAILATAALQALAAPIETDGDFESTPDEATIDDELAAEELGPDDEAPPAEYPYPGTIDKNLQIAPSTVPSTDNNGYALERPRKIDEETGVYHYDTDLPPAEFSGRTDVVSPRKTSPRGEFIYDRETTPSPFKSNYGGEKPVEMRANGEFYYATENSPERGSFSFRFGMMPPPDLRNAQTGATFQSIYTKNDSVVALFDYESKITGRIGRLGLKFGSGIYTAQGIGQFRNATTVRRSDDVPEERYSFLLFPNSLTGIYRFQYADKQVLVPFVEGGIGYFGFMELRDDNITPKIGGAAVSIAAGGLNLNLDWLDRRAIRALDNEYGVNHVWLTTEFRVLVGLNKTYDFTSNVFNAGILLEF